ncbi:hypothetical protein RRV45_20075 [Bacillus sp. DTU_2020_1000418_1_SI_GHA_SEK_038]|uniref:hypothetical protein n=1 Tax=Bacillus sp. DTU_2020_1000418_1_SI_GHA_SEK_038 TaxID=3077585 RepID=UPI0028EDEDD9|nr:hypothetical protein [Bacillus sp. DTU_2020_1000418_1_SI_GHA_SEK_038]WNS75148.1 hypothetical protein RRV45_20075 [Bacillus sp. DTU_2020_1000418_1_SI_GHA_SEK_038]
MWTSGSLFSLNAPISGAKRTQNALFTKKHKEITAFLQNSVTYVRKHKELTHFVTYNGAGVRQVRIDKIRNRGFL